MKDDGLRSAQFQVAAEFHEPPSIPPGPFVLWLQAGASKEDSRHPYPLLLNRVAVSP